MKLVVFEPESDALRRELADGGAPISCALVRVEVVRASAPALPDGATRARRVLSGMRLLRLDDALLDVAASLSPVTLRSLDAIHLAAALSLGSALSALVTYDDRLGKAAAAIGVPVATPR